MLRNAEAEIAHAPTMTKMGDAGTEGERPELDGEDDAAGYLFEILVAARRLAVMRKHRFLAYLIGMAVEESRLLAQGRSAIGQ